MATTSSTTSTSTIAAVFISCIVVSSFLVTNANLSSASDCKLENNGCFYVHSQAAAAAAAYVDNVNHPILIPNRKMLVGVAANINEGVEKRDVPSGPDPLHHNGIGGPVLQHQNPPRITP